MTHTEKDDLVERLRAEEEQAEGPFSMPHRLCQKAATRIEALERECDEAREAALEEAAKVCERDITSLTVIEFDGSRRTLDDRELEVVKFAIKGRAAVIRDLRRAARAYAGTTKGELT